jgi:hypothetical protein
MIEIFLRLSLFAFLALLFVQRQKGSSKIEIVLANISSIDLTDKTISIKRDQILEIPQEKVFPLIISFKGDTIPAQLDDLNGDKIWDELFFVIDLSTNKRADYTLQWLKEKPDLPIRSPVYHHGDRSTVLKPIWE